MISSGLATPSIGAAARVRVPGRPSLDRAAGGRARSHRGVEPRRDAEHLAQLALAVEHPEEQRPEPDVLGGQQQRHHRHRRVDRPVRHRPRVGPAPRPVRALSGSAYRSVYASGSAKRQQRSPVRRAAAASGTSRRRTAGSVMSQNSAVSSPSSTTRCQPWVLPALGARDARSTRSSITPGRRRRVERPRHPPIADDVGELGHDRLSQRSPSLTRSSAMVQPYTTITPPLATGTCANISTTIAGRACSGFDDSKSRKPRLAAGLDDERLGVVLRCRRRTAWPDGGPRPAPRRRQSVPGDGVTLVELLERLEAVGVDEPGADHDVFVGERHQRTVVGLAHQAAQHLVTLGVRLHAHQPDQDARRAADALERREREAVQLAVDPGRGDQHPVFLGLGERPMSKAPSIDAISSRSASVSAARRW